MNRLWIRLSLSFSLVLLAVLSLPMLLFWLAFMHRGAWRPMMFNGRVPDGAIAAGMFAMLIMATLFSAFVGVIAGILVSRGLSRQVANLAAATQAITPENLSLRVPVQGVKELQDLAASFNWVVDALDQAQQARRGLLADVSHELLTPLTVLEGNLRAMLDGVYALNEEEISYLYDQTHHLIGLVKELRQLTQAETHQLSLQRQETAVNDIIEETIALFAPFAKEKQITLRQVFFPNLPTILIDQQHLRQVLSNLLANALRHTPGAGVISIETLATVTGVQLRVQDTGEGLTPAELAQIFDRYYRSDNTRRRDAGGAGLGLAIVKALVEAHGGTITAESTPQQGTTFILDFPQAVRTNSNSP